MTIDEDIILSDRYNEIRDTIDLIDRIDDLTIYSICNIGETDPHFIITKNYDYGTKVARISLTEPRYLSDGDLILNQEELELIYNNLSNGSWNKIFESMNTEGKYFIQDFTIDVLKMPNYKEIING